MEISRSTYLNERFLNDDEYSQNIMKKQKSDLNRENCIELHQFDEIINNNNCLSSDQFNTKLKPSISLENEVTDVEKNHIYKSSYSLNELDQIKRGLPDMSKEKYKATFTTLNQRLRTKLARAILEFSNKMPYLERLIRKDGEANIVRRNIKSRHIKYFWDFFNTIVDMKWRYILFIFACLFLASWGLFALLWFILGSDCIPNLGDSFFDALLFSIETQQTIGYGFRYVSNTCPTSIIILMAQCGFSVVFESLMGGIVFAKLSRPKKRTETLVFSKKACIAPRDGQLCLMLRAGDLRKSHIIHAYIRMFLIRTRITKEGEVIPWNTQELNLSNNSQTSDRLIFMPIIVEHIINDSSPLKPLINYSSQRTPKRFKYEDFEIVVILEGTVESTGQTTQARTSFLPSEILWNHVFEPLMDSNCKSKATIDFSKFDFTKKLSRTKKSIKRNLLPRIFLHNGKRFSKISESLSSSTSTIASEKIV